MMKASKTNMTGQPDNNVWHPTASTCCLCWTTVVGNSSFSETYVYAECSVDCCRVRCVCLFPVVQRPQMGHGLIILEVSRSHTDDITPLDEWSARRRDLHVTTHNTKYRQTFMLPAAGFEPAVSASERTQTHALERAATGTRALCNYPFGAGIIFLNFSTSCI